MGSDMLKGLFWGENFAFFKPHRKKSSTAFILCSEMFESFVERIALWGKKHPHNHNCTEICMANAFGNIYGDGPPARGYPLQ